MLGKWLMKNSEAKNRVMRDFGYLRRGGHYQATVALAAHDVMNNKR